MKSIVVTGASTGIGWGCVKVLIAGGARVFGNVRKQVDADRLSAAFGPNFTPLLFDVTDGAAVAAGARQVEAALGGETLSGLVNNAGIAVPGPLLYLKVDDFASAHGQRHRPSSRRPSRLCSASTARAKVRPVAS
jgi:NAD(P)-dependent dehydrogenase (short-subunit alcohol dehydrogenase family)